MRRFINDIKEQILNMKIWQLILIIVFLTVVPSCAGYYSYVNSINRLATEQKNQEELKERTAVDDVIIKYKSALQAKNQKDWNKVISILNTIDIDTDILKKNEDVFRTTHKLSNDKLLKEAIYNKKWNDTLFVSEKEKEAVEYKYEKILEIKPITNLQINILKQFAEGMIEFEKGNYKKADDIFCSIHDVFESDVLDEYNEIHNKTIKLLTVEVPVKIIGATCVMEKDGPYFTITIENPLNETVFVSNIVISAIDQSGKLAHYYGDPHKYQGHESIFSDIPAMSRKSFSFRNSAFLHNIKYYLLSVDDFHMRGSDKSYSELEKYTEGKVYKIEVKY